MSFHPNDVQRRGRTASLLLIGVCVLLLSAFFRAQVLRNTQYVLQSEQNRLREVPLPAPRGIVYDRVGRIIAENVPGYSVSLLAPTADSMRASLRRLSAIVPLSDDDIVRILRRYDRAGSRPTVIMADAPFDVISVLEEHRIEFPGLIIQSAPKRHYPDGDAVASFIGYTGEITEGELNLPQFKDSYKQGQQVGKGGLEKQYEARLHGREGTRFVEVDARGRVVREVGARQDIPPEAPLPLYTNIDLDLQRYATSLFGDSVLGAVVAMEPHSGAVLALVSAPSFDPNRFIGGVSKSYYDSLNTDPRRPLYNKAVQGQYPPASTWKLATALLALERNLVTLDQTMPVPCNGGYQYGGRYFKCWDKKGHGNVNLKQAIEKSCDTYFYQLGLKLGLRNMIAGGVRLGFDRKTGIDLPVEKKPLYPDRVEYFDKLYGARGWTNAVVLNLSIGQGENAQTVVNMARFYTALATDGHASRPMIARGEGERTQIFRLTQAQMDGLREALSGVVTARGTAGSAALQGTVLAGKTGTAQNAGADHAWFVGFAPANDPKIVVAVFIEFGEHGYAAARVASKVIEYYLKATPTSLVQTEG